MQIKNQKPTFISDKVLIFLLFIYIVILLFFGSKMSPFYASNEWADPNVYFNVAKGMLNGKTLYTEIFDHKGPLIFFIYGAGYFISNTSFFGMFLIQIINWTILLLFVYLTAKLYLNKAYSFIICIIFSLFLMKLFKAGGSAEEFILTWECISLYCFIKFFRQDKLFKHPPHYMFIHGILCTMTLLTKINLIIFWFFPLLFIFLSILWNKNFKNFLLNVIYFILGVCIISLPIIFYLYSHNALIEAYNIYIVLNSKYSQISSVKNTLLLLLQRLTFLFIDSCSLLVFPAIGLFYFSIKYIKSKIASLSIILSGISSYIIIFMTPMFQYYYPIPFLVFDVLGLIGLFLYLQKYISYRYSLYPLILITTISIFLGLSIKLLTNTWVESTALKQDKYLTENLRNVLIKEKKPTLLNLGFGLGNSLFTTCNIVPNVKYFIKPNLSYRIYPQLRDEQSSYIKDKKTQFIILPRRVYKGKINNNYIKVEKTDEFTYYYNLSTLKENYNLIMIDTIKNKIDENSLEIYYLYKIKNP